MLPQGYEFQGPAYKSGRQQGELARARLAVTTVLGARGLEVPPEVQQRIDECTDLQTLEQWLRRAVAVGSAAELTAHAGASDD